MKTAVLYIASVMILLLACSKSSPLINPDGNEDPIPIKDTCTITTKMISNGAQYDSICYGSEMGKITVVQGPKFMTVTYDITAPGWLFQQTQLYIGPEPDMPNQSGNPAPGQFPYKGDHAPGVTHVVYGPLPVPDSSYIVAAHSDVTYQIAVDSVGELCGYLPDTVDFIAAENQGPNSYLNITVFNGFWLNGTYEGWCLDLDHLIVKNTLYEDAAVYCSYEPVPDSIVDHPENLDLINWIINYISVGQNSSCGGSYTWGDIQRAMWELIDDTNTYIGLGGNWSQCRADEIVAKALASGEGYEPGCNDYFGVLLKAKNVQTILISVPFPCYPPFNGGAWGYGQNGTYCDPDGADGISFTDSKYYGGSKWGWYFYGCF